MTYKIVRRFFNQDYYPEVIHTGYSLEEAQDWCNDPETSSSTATLPQNQKITETYGPWFDGYEEE